MFFFQRHGDALNVFSISVDKAHRGEKLFEKAGLDFLEYARNIDGIKRVRLDAGSQKAIDVSFEKLRQAENILNIKTRPGYWVEFPEK